MAVRMTGCSVYSSTTTPIPISEYKATVPPGITAYLNTLKTIAATAVKKAKLLAATILDKLNMSGIRKILSAILAVRNTVMNAVKAAVSWVAAAVKGITNLVNDIVQGVRNLADDLVNMLKASSIYQIANTLCGGIDLSGIAAQIAQIRVNMDWDSVLDYALGDLDSGLFDNIKNCTLFKKDSVQKVKDALDTVFDKSNVIMLDCMRDTVDYNDLTNVDRKFRSTAMYMADDEANRAALASIFANMSLTSDVLMTFKDPRFSTKKIYIVEDTKSLYDKVPKYVKAVITDQNATLIAAAAQHLAS